MRKGLIIGLCCVLGTFCLSSNAQEALPNDSTILKNARREAKENAIKTWKIAAVAAFCFLHYLSN